MRKLNMKKKSNLNLAKKSVNAVKVIEICPYHMPYAINAICFIVCKNLEEDCMYVYTMTPQYTMMSYRMSATYGAIKIS